MKNSQKNIENFIESSLRKTPVAMTSDDFTKNLIKAVHSEAVIAAAEAKQERFAKYILAVFSVFIAGFTVLVAVLSGSKAPETKGVDITPAIETSNNYFERFTSFIESLFVQVLHLIGLSASSRTISMVITILGIVCMFMLAERFLIRGRIKTGVGIK